MKYFVCAGARIYRIYRSFIAILQSFLVFILLVLRKHYYNEEQLNFKSSSQYRDHVLKTTKKPLDFCTGVLFFTNPDTETIHDSIYQII